MDVSLDCSAAMPTKVYMGNYREDELSRHLGFVLSFSEPFEYPLVLKSHLDLANLSLFHINYAVATADNFDSSEQANSIKTVSN